MTLRAVRSPRVHLAAVSALFIDFNRRAPGEGPERRENFERPTSTSVGTGSTDVARAPPFQVARDRMARPGVRFDFGESIARAYHGGSTAASLVVEATAWSDGHRSRHAIARYGPAAVRLTLGRIRGDSASFAGEASARTNMADIAESTAWCSLREPWFRAASAPSATKLAPPVVEGVAQGPPGASSTGRTEHRLEATSRRTPAVVTIRRWHPPEGWRSTPGLPYHRCG